MDILNLPPWRVTACDEGKDRYLLYAEPSSPKCRCPSCGRSTLAKHGSDAQVIRDLPIHGKAVYIHLNHQRFRCTTCRKTCYQPLPEIDAKRFMTRRLVAYIVRKTLSTNRTFVSIAEEINVDKSTIRHVFDDAAARLKQTVTFETPAILGIDELHVLGSPRGVLTNLEAHTILDLLEDRRKASIIQALRHLKTPDSVRVAVIDLWKPYREALREALPEAVIVCDKFHVLKLVTTALETFRKRMSTGLSEAERKTLKMHDRFLLLRRERDLSPEDRFILEIWTRSYPLLGVAHRLKEQFFSIYDYSTLAEAHTAYLRWMDDVPKELLHIYLPVMLTIEEWAEHIFAHFAQDHITGGFVESANGIARCLNRIGRGYSLPVLRARLLYGMRGVDQQATCGLDVDLQGMGVAISTLVSQGAIPG